ncbi:MAG TPA: type IV toxin-antitoxin system AbiEi family antitoxin domain-containing protein [Solirubrobacterales bacterium]|nr:type IV toxin-antitoxin system AbiEi family antitoxin domain-containing protein [Solirubrobacterales bacterium]
MRSQSRTHRADRVIAALAGRQHGVVARYQLIERGVTGRQIKWRLANGRLHEIHRGVYLVGHEIPPRYAMESAAILAFRGEATLSHRTAASIWSLLPHPAPGDVCVTIPPARSSERPRIETYRTTLAARDIRHTHGLPLTSPPRTILDLSVACEEGELEALVAEAEYRGLARLPELEDQIQRNSRKRGVPKVRRVLDLAGGPRRTRSQAERWLLALLRREDLTGFETNVKVGGWEVDFYFPHSRLVVEVDGYDAHGGRVAFERDRLKVAELSAAGLRVMLVTGRQVRNDPTEVIDRLMAALRSGG